MDIEDASETPIRLLCVVLMLLKVLSEASLAYESGLQQRNTTTSSSSATACAGAVAAAYNDAWEKFSLDGDRPVDTHQPAVDSVKESSQL